MPSPVIVSSIETINKSLQKELSATKTKVISLEQQIAEKEHCISFVQSKQQTLQLALNHSNDTIASMSIRHDMLIKQHEKLLWDLRADRERSQRSKAEMASMHTRMADMNQNYVAMVVHLDQVKAECFKSQTNIAILHRHIAATEKMIVELGMARAATTQIQEGYKAQMGSRATSQKSHMLGHQIRDLQNLIHEITENSNTNKRSLKAKLKRCQSELTDIKNKKKENGLDLKISPRKARQLKTEADSQPEIKGPLSDQLNESQKRSKTSVQECREAIRETSGHPQDENHRVLIPTEERIERPEIGIKDKEIKGKEQGNVQQQTELSINAGDHLEEKYHLDLERSEDLPGDLRQGLRIPEIVSDLESQVKSLAKDISELETNEKAKEQECQELMDDMWQMTKDLERLEQQNAHLRGLSITDGHMILETLSCNKSHLCTFVCDEVLRQLDDIDTASSANQAVQTINALFAGIEARTCLAVHQTTANAVLLQQLLDVVQSTMPTTVEIRDMDGKKMMLQEFAALRKIVKSLRRDAARDLSSKHNSKAPGFPEPNEHSFPICLEAKRSSSLPAQVIGTLCSIALVYIAIRSFPWLPDVPKVGLCLLVFNFRLIWASIACQALGNLGYKALPQLADKFQYGKKTTLRPKRGADKPRLALLPASKNDQSVSQALKVRKPRT
ncbi:hypothetical protein ACHAPU_011543 [Fusarium lateritium]